MNLYNHKKDFNELISIVAAFKNLPESAIERDYFIVLLLNNLANSEYINQCVFKGGTSLSKCHPNSIERFSEDIITCGFNNQKYAWLAIWWIKQNKTRNTDIYWRNRDNIFTIQAIVN